jgi:pimeloyl-ACP methyl ester carboxylesterase
LTGFGLDSKPTMLKFEVDPTVVERYFRRKEEKEKKRKEAGKKPSRGPKLTLDESIDLAQRDRTHLEKLWAENFERTSAIFDRLTKLGSIAKAIEDSARQSQKAPFARVYVIPSNLCAGSSDWYSENDAIGNIYWSIHSAENTNNFFANYDLVYLCHELMHLLLGRANSVDSHALIELCFDEDMRHAFNGGETTRETFIGHPELRSQKRVLLTEWEAAKPLPSTFFDLVEQVHRSPRSLPRGTKKINMDWNVSSPAIVTSPPRHFVLFPPMLGTLKIWEEGDASPSFRTKLDQFGPSFAFTPEEWMFVGKKEEYKAPQDFSFEQYSSRLRHCLDKAELTHDFYPPYYLIGSSHGGACALNFAKLFPELTESVLLLDSVEHTPEKYAALGRRLATVPPTEIVANFQAAVQFVSTDGLPFTEIPTPQLQAIETFIVSNLHKYWDQIPDQISCPLHYAYNYSEPRHESKAAYAALLAKKNPCCGIYRISNSGHLLFKTNGDRILDIIRGRW